MRTFQFTCAVRIIETGVLMPIAGLITPPVTANTPTEAMLHADTVNYCNENRCSVYRMVT